jgi:ATP-binding cassette subfamily C protein
MHQAWPAFRSYVHCLAKHAGARLWISLALLISVGFLEGSGLLLLLPLLQLIGLGEVSGAGGIGQAAAAVLRSTHLPLTLAGVLAVFVAVMALQAWLRLCLDVLNTRIETAWTCFLRERLYRAMVGADWLFFTRQRSSDIVQVLTEELQRVGFGAQQLLALLGLAGLAAVQVALALSLSPMLTAFALACGAAVALGLRPLGRQAHALGRISQEKRAEMAAAVTEHLGGMKIAKSHGREMHHLDVFRRVIHEIAAHWVRAMRVQALTRVAFEFGGVLALSAFLYFAVKVAGIQPAGLVLLAFIFTRLLPRMVAIQGNWQRVLQALPSYEAAERLRRQFLAAQEPAWPDTRARIVLRQEVRFENVSFRYGEGREPGALQEVNLAIPARQVTAICGPSGAGKSTLADLLLGLLQPSAGRILVDGEPLAGSRLHAWRQSIGYVPQETFLFHDTVRANLLWARPEATESEVRAALRAAAAEEFVNQLSDGLDTVTGDRGVRLSGGERQRLALARAVLRQPSVLVLDEATSSLDTQNEHFIQQALDRLHGELTIVIIAHRLSTVRIADQIIVLKGGRMVETGAWDDLCQREGGVFRELASAGTVGLQ